MNPLRRFITGVGGSYMKKYLINLRQNSIGKLKQELL